MKITIYVKEDHLENLHSFLLDDKVRNVRWYHDRPGNGKFYEVTLTYDDFIKLKDSSEDLHN